MVFRGTDNDDKLSEISAGTEPHAGENSSQAIDTVAYSISGFCAATGLSRSGVYRLFNTGAITPRKFGSRTLILRSDAEAWLASLPEAK